MDNPFTDYRVLRGRVVLDTKIILPEKVDISTKTPEGMGRD